MSDAIDVSAKGELPEFSPKAKKRLAKVTIDLVTGQGWLDELRDAYHDRLSKPRPLTDSEARAVKAQRIINEARAAILAANLELKPLGLRLSTRVRSISAEKGARS